MDRTLVFFSYDIVFKSQFFKKQHRETMATSLPEPFGIKTLEIGANSVYLRWAISSQHGLSKEQLKSLQFEFKSSDNKLRADCIDNEPLEEYKARLCGLSEDKRYRFQRMQPLRISS